MRGRPVLLPVALLAAIPLLGAFPAGRAGAARPKDEPPAPVAPPAPRPPPSPPPVAPPGPRPGGPATPAPARPTGEALEAEVDRLLAGLASDDFSAREAARRGLERIAPSAHAVLVARRDHPDPEVRRTVRNLLDAISGSAPEAPGPPADLSEVGSAAIASSGTLADALSRWEAAFGGRVRVPASSAATAVTVDLPKTACFEALDAILAQARLEAPDGFDDAGAARTAPRPAEGAAGPRAYAGAFRMDVEQVHAIRDWRGAAGRMRYAISLRAFWSPQVQVVTYAQPTLVSAVDDAGKAWKTLDPQVTVQHGAAGGRRTWNELRVTLDPPEGATSKTLTEVKVAMKMRVRHGLQEVRFEDPAGTELPAVRTVPVRTETPGEVRVSLESFGPDAEAQGWSQAGLSVRLPPSVPAERLSVALEAATGDPRSMYDRADRVAASDGLLKLTLRAPGSREEGKPKAVRVSWYAREGDATVTFTLKGVALP